MLFTWIVKTCQRHLSRLTWPALLGLFIGQYLLCYLVLRLLRESALVSQLSDFIYYCSVVGSTLGFGDLSPQTAPGRLFTALWQIPVSVGLFGALMGKVIAQVQGMLAKGITGMGDYRHLHHHMLVIGWRGHQTEKMISLLLYDKRRAFERVLLCELEDIQHPLPGNNWVDFIRISNFNDPQEHQRMGLEQCQSVIIFARTDEQTFTAALSLADYVPAQCHIVVYLEDERYAGLLETHCPRMEIVRNLSAEQLSRSIQDPGSSQSVASIMNPMLGDTGFALPVPASVAPMRYGALMRYMKLLGISHCKNGRGMELNPVISTEVRGGMWLHLVGNNRILAEEVAWQEIEVPL
ncbi:two pore domain potassium channel family protein [Salmonella enterica subsp. enterica serovar Litchfield]|nr:two pore domain potassium channel family protein [Salmonella enterica]EBZ4914659.1 two pore domain potassium channel family protein [Salmonella enterica subsp. enterica serovar Litchfield]ECD6506387.1 two pore domain potassium channel family protein [Salmonella enterica subsp. enterica serovar Litchfield]ECY4900007.1 two pore domain potassium channel family protein [Salmonella enterica subsp. enterica serovar Litchfield]EDV5209215.1 two pore domain potassium channel family protein [Salmonell